MPRLNPEARQRLVATAADMLRRRGLSSTSIRELAKAAKAPLGSTYHYFPGGKQQLIREAIGFAGGKIRNTLASELERGPVDGLRAFLTSWKEVLTSTQFRAGCPVVAVALEEASSDEEQLTLDAVAAVFANWEQVLSQSLRDHGVEDSEADQLATLIVASVEGSIALCRAKRSTGPLDVIGSQLEELVRAATAH